MDLYGVGVIVVWGMDDGVVDGGEVGFVEGDDVVVEGCCLVGDVVVGVDLDVCVSGDVGVECV